jgi:hypothetical protein
MMHSGPTSRCMLQVRHPPHANHVRLDDLMGYIEVKLRGPFLLQNSPKLSFLKYVTCQSTSYVDPSDT